MNYQFKLIIQAVMIAVVGVLLSAALYSDWFQACCMDFFRTSVGLLTIPAIFIAMAIGGVHSSTSTHFTIGLVVELLTIWGVWRIIMAVRRKKNAIRT
jgi:hypothetical protein